jgi:hypothetical protein
VRNEDNPDLYSSSNRPTIRVKKSTRMTGAGHVAHMRRGRVMTGLWLGNVKKVTTWKN